MKRLGWLSVGIVLSIAVAGAIYATPTIAATFSGHSTPSAILAAGTDDVDWGAGNACSAPYGSLVPTTYMGHIVETCDVQVSGTPANPFTGTPGVYPVVWWNFSAGENFGEIFMVNVIGSYLCVNFNFHGFYGDIDLAIAGSDYLCPSSGGPLSVAGAPAQSGGLAGVNVAVNSEGDSVSILAQGSDYQSLFYVYGTTSSVNFVLDGSNLQPTIFFIGTTAGFGTCPSGITYGRIVEHAVSLGSKNTLSTIWVDGSNVAYPPVNVPYYTVHWWPINGGLGTGDKLGFEVTQTAPSEGCGYL